MNERIRELADEAGLRFAQLMSNPMVPIVDGKETDLAKFALLIVGECVNMLSAPEYVMNHPEELADYNRGWVNGRLLGIDHIKQHFGVEE